MREVLFKAKRLSNAEWVEGYYIGPVGVLNVHEICDIHDIAGTRVEVDPSTVCQYTGQVDYESEEPIFCDDLLKSQNTHTLSALKMAVTLPENTVRLELGHPSRLKISNG